MRRVESWRGRYARYWRELLPYIVYAIRSGLGMAVVLIFLLGSFYYARLLDSPPSTFPTKSIALLLLVPCIAYSPIRTLLRDADSIFLVPNVTALKPYFRSGFIAAFIQQSFVAVAVWFVYWPLFRVMEHAEMIVFYKMAGLLLVLKLFTLTLTWKERQLRDALWRISFSFLRWLWVALALYVLLAYSFVRAVPFIVLSMVLLLVLLRLPVSYRIHWHHLIELEHAARGRMNRFLAWFVDVPSVSGSPRRRRGLDGIAQIVPYSAKYAYTYLYLLIFLRSDGFSIIARLSLIGTVLVVLLENEWAKAVVYMMAGWISALQLSTLEQAYRHSDWMHIYPLRRQLRIDALLRLTWMLHMAGMLPVIISSFIVMSLPMAVLLTSLLLIGSTIYYGLLLRRKWSRREDALA